LGVLPARILLEDAVTGERIESLLSDLETPEEQGLATGG
jgi:hypothetical protein